MALTKDEITAELAAVHAARLRILQQKEVEFNQNGRQVVLSGPAALRWLTEHEQWLLAQLTQLEHRGIRIRTGVPR